ncbi:MAG: hypothetical protein LCH93_13690 [Proteobacteria bacterium]|nr:hypothetical protein [Pseudomonadota bacterium]
MKRRGFLFSVAAVPLAPLVSAPALAQGGMVEAAPALLGEIGNEVIFPGKRWRSLYVTDDLLAFCEGFPDPIVINEGE